MAQAYLTLSELLRGLLTEERESRVGNIPFTAKIPALTTSPIKLGEITIAGRILLTYIDIPSGWQYSAGIRAFDKHTGKWVMPDFTKGGDLWITGDDSFYVLPINKKVSTIVIEGINNTAYDQPFTIIFIVER